MTTPKPITQFDRTSLRAIQEECLEALKPIAEKYGLVLDRKRASYYSDRMPVMAQFLVKEMDKNGNVLTAQAQDFQKLALAYGLKPDDLGKEFSSLGERYRITGLKPKSPKYPVLAESLTNGKTYKFRVEVVKGALERAA